MNFYEWIIENIKLGEKKHNCPSTCELDSKKEKFFKNKTLEQIQKEASKYGLYVRYEDSNYFHDNPPYVFTLAPVDEHGFPIRKWDEK